MTWSSFETKVSGKWVLTGEHAVLRGASAIALPHPEFGLELSFKSSHENWLEVVPASAQGVVQEILDGLTFAPPSGKLEIRSTIPIGAGLGSSAALCVAMGRWLSEKLDLKTPASLQEFATRLEHRFHGRSSGMDVAVIVAGQPISFVMASESGQTGASLLGVRHLPRFSFHDTGLRARTSDCVLKVEELRKRDLPLATHIDEQMSAASKLALEGLVQYDLTRSPEALGLIASAMRHAQECFYSWQLIPPQAKQIQDQLISQGALATKITGAGDGGMIVALWPDPAQ